MENRTSAAYVQYPKELEDGNGAWGTSEPDDNLEKRGIEENLREIPPPKSVGGSAPLWINRYFYGRKKDLDMNTGHVSLLKI